MTVWQTTVDQLLLIFRDALRALVPHVERARMEWRDGSAYDDWDEIAQTLLRKDRCFVAALGHAGERARGVRSVAYNMTYASHAGKTVIVVDGMSHKEKLVFHSFATEKFHSTKFVPAEWIVMGEC